MIEKISRFVFFACVIIVALAIPFLAGAYAYMKDLPPIPQLEIVKEVLTGERDLITADRDKHLQPARGQGSGVVLNNAPDDALIAMMGFFDEENQARLVRTDGSLVNAWTLDVTEHFPDPDIRPCNVKSPLLTDLHGFHVTPEGDLIFNYEYCGTIRLDRCGEIKWTIAERTHHSLIPAEGGGYILLGRDRWNAGRNPDRFPPFSSPPKGTNITEDTIMIIDEDGTVLERRSIPQMMVDSGLGALLTANGRNFGTDSIRGELVHANKVAELTADTAAAFPMFNHGDLLVSLRNLNLIFVVDRKSWRITWHQMGPWLRQHDPEFAADGRITIFNNNVYKIAYLKDRTRLDLPRVTNILAIDPDTRKTEILFGERPGEEMLSVIRGQHELLDDGGMIISEFDAGRVIWVDGKRNIIWDYVNAVGDDDVGEITNADVYPSDYFTTEFADCQ